MNEDQRHPTCTGEYWASQYPPIQNLNAWIRKRREETEWRGTIGEVPPERPLGDQLPPPTEVMGYIVKAYRRTK